MHDSLHHSLSKRAFFVFLPLGIAASLSGCTTPYVNATGPATASIEFIDEAPNKMSVAAYAGAEECKNRANIGLIEPKEKRKIVVPTGGNFVFTVAMDTFASKMQFTMAVMGGGAVGGGAWASSNPNGCKPTIDFTPASGKSYIFRLDSDGSTCKYQFSEQKSATEVLPVSFVERVWITPWDERGPFCKKK